MQGCRSLRPWGAPRGRSERGPSLCPRASVTHHPGFTEPVQEPAHRARRLCKQQTAERTTLVARTGRGRESFRGEAALGSGLVEKQGFCQKEKSSRSEEPGAPRWLRGPWGGSFTLPTACAANPAAGPLLVPGWPALVCTVRVPATLGDTAGHPGPRRPLCGRILTAVQQWTGAPAPHGDARCLYGGHVSSRQAQQDRLRAKGPSTERAGDVPRSLGQAGVPTSAEPRTSLPLRGAPPGRP